MKGTLRTAALALSLAASAGLIGAAALASEGTKPPAREWSFEGLFGTFDRGGAQRGFQVYSQVCAGCHSMSLLAYRNLAGIGFGEEQIKKIAAEFEVTDGPNADGDMFQRPALPADRFVAPFANDNAAAASNNGKVPPDLSLMVKARKGGADYVYGILTGYGEAPKDVEVPDGSNYNKYFPGNIIAMAPPLSDDAVEYSDGTKATAAQLAQDVTTFLAWAAEPELEERKRMGVKVLLFLIVLTAMLYALKRQIWKDLH